MQRSNTPQNRHFPRYAAIPLVVAGGAAMAIWGWSQPEPLTAAFMVAAVLGFAIALRLGRYAWSLIFSDEVSWDRFPLENLLPVKGRWLRLLVLGPLALLYLGLCWGAVSLLIGFAVITAGMLVRTLFGG